MKLKQLKDGFSFGQRGECFYSGKCGNAISVLAYKAAVQPRLATSLHAFLVCNGSLLVASYEGAASSASAILLAQRLAR